MVDLETASTKENAAILSWAMVPFFTDGSEFTDMEEFYRVISLTSCFLAGMDFDRNTQKWWMEQDPKARGMFLHAEDANIHGVASEAYTWLSNLSEKYDLYLWARGLDFDIPKMEWCFRKFVERPLPYKYSHKMDVRTVLKFMQIDQSQFEMQGIKHNALDDCKHDIRMIQEAYKWKGACQAALLSAGIKKVVKDYKEKSQATMSEAENKAKEILSDNSQKEGCQKTKPSRFLPNISSIIGTDINTGEQLSISGGVLELIEMEINDLKRECNSLILETEALKQEIKNLQAMG